MRLTESEFQQLPALESVMIGDIVTCYHYRNTVDGSRWYETGRQAKVTRITRTTVTIGNVAINRKTGKSYQDSRFFWRKTQ